MCFSFHPLLVLPFKVLLPLLGPCSSFWAQHVGASMQLALQARQHAWFPLGLKPSSQAFSFCSPRGNHACCLAVLSLHTLPHSPGRPIVFINYMDLEIKPRSSHVNHIICHWAGPPPLAVHFDSAYKTFISTNWVLRGFEQITFEIGPGKSGNADTWSGLFFYKVFCTYPCIGICFLHPYSSYSVDIGTGWSFFTYSFCWDVLLTKLCCTRLSH